MKDIQPLVKFWPLIHSVIREFWEITEPYIEEAALKKDVPIELYLYSELGLEYFSVEEFQKRDPFSNPDHFEKMFTRFDVKGWVFPLPDDRYQVSRDARDAVREMIEAGDAKLVGFDLMPSDGIKKLAGLLKKLAKANIEASEPPHKWAIIRRFRAAHPQSPEIVQVRELLMDLFAYRDDAHLSAARPHFGQAGIVWSVLGAITKREAVTAKRMAERMAFRGYQVADYEVAIQAAIEIGWVEPDDVVDTFRPTEEGSELRSDVEKLTDVYFYRPWSVLKQEELDTLFTLLTSLRDHLTSYKKNITAG